MVGASWAQPPRPCLGLYQWGVGFASLIEKVETGSAVGKPNFQLFAVFAEFSMA